MSKPAATFNLLMPGCPVLCFINRNEEAQHQFVLKVGRNSFPAT